MKTSILLALAAFAVAPLPAQLAAPNSAGVAMGHVHLNVKDIDAQLKFWALLGGVPVNNEKLQMVQFPGVYIVLRKQDSTGGTVGSVINHFGFHVKNINDWLPKWKDAGIPIERVGNPKQAFLTGPDAIKIEILEDDTIKTPLEMHHVHLFVPDAVAAQAWYVKNFGATPGKRGNFETATVGGAEIAFQKNDPQEPTKGRSVDHVGFEIKGLDAFVKKIEADGSKTDGIHTSANASKLHITFLTDPWGTYIELTEGLAPAATAASR